MRKELSCLFVSGLLIACCYAIIVNNNTIVKSDTPQQLISNTLPLDFIWEWTNKFANIVGKYSPGEIVRGRAFASSGGTNASELISKELEEGLELETVNEEQLQYIDADHNGYSKIINVTNWGLTVNTDIPFPFSSKTLTKNEMYSMPSKNGHLFDPLYWTSSISFNEVSIELADFTYLYPLAGTYNDYFYQASNYTFLSSKESHFVGKAIYLSPEDPIPSLDEQENSVFLLDDVESSQSKLDNLTYADAAIIIESEGRGVQNVSTNQAVIPVVNVTSTVGQTVKEIIENNNLTIVDNIGNEGQTLTFTYNLFDGFWPNSAFVFFDRIPDHYWLWDHDEGYLHDITRSLDLDKPNIIAFLVCIEYISEVWLLLSSLHPLTPCMGIVLADHGDYHYMLSNPRTAYSIFTVNESIGNFLETFHESATLTGYTLQEYLPENFFHPIGGIGYNIYGNLSISKSPNNARVIVSNRYDGMWGQTPGDSGVGTAIVLGLAKFFKENEIPRKYNMTFLFTTGEEYGFLGAKYFRDYHDDLNINYWFILDQLAFNQQDTALCLHACGLNNNTNAVIASAIINDTHYWPRTGYNNITTTKADSGSEQGQITGGFENTRQTFCFVKDQDTRWDEWHRTGNNFQNGDSLTNTDRNDINVTTELFWRLLEYYCVNPNCHFNSASYETCTSSEGGVAHEGTTPNALKATFEVESALPCDIVMINASLHVASSGLCMSHTFLNFTADKDGSERNIALQMPQGVKEGDYYIELELYNSTARINRIVDFNYSVNQTITSPTFHLNQYHTLGDVRIGTSNANTHNTIRGSKFTVAEDALVHNITAYVYGISQYPPAEPTYQCMIYQTSDGHIIGYSNQVACYETGWLTFTFTPKPVLIHNTQYMLCIWGNNENAVVYSTPQSQANGYVNGSYTFGTPPSIIAWDPMIGLQQYSLFCRYTLDIYLPQINDVTANPHTVGFGYNVTITANVTDNHSGVKNVSVKISYPEVGGMSNYTYPMDHVSGNMYRYIFVDTWQVGQYNYSIWAQDNENNTDTSTGYYFHVSADATISIATLKDSYSGSQYINITDPPNPPEEYTLVANGETWNEYYDATSGNNILESYAGSVNYQENTGSWTPINTTFIQLPNNHPAYTYGYRMGNNRGPYGAYFKPNPQDNWPVAFTYNRSDNPTTNVIRSKLVGVGYLDPQSNWAYEYLQNAQSSQGQTNDNSITYTNVFTGTDVTWSYGNTELKEEITLSNVTKTVLQNHPPSQYGLNDASSYLVFITKLDHQNLDMYTTSGMLTGNVTISNAGVDFKDALGQFKCALPLGEAYELNNESVRQKLTYRIVHLNGDTYLLSGLKVSDLNAMTFPVVIDPTLTVNSLSNDGYIYNSSTTYSTARNASSGTVDSSATYLSIGQKKVPGFPATYNIYRGFVLFNTSALPSNAYLDSTTLSLYKKDDYSTTDFMLTIQNGQPTYPHNPLQASDYAKGHYSGNGGSLNTINFVNGRNNITLTNLSWINMTGTTKLSLRSSRDINGTTPPGNEYVNVYSANAPLGGYVPKLIITYRNQSKIKNTGSTDIKGYLLIQVQFYETSKGVAPRWVVDNDTVNETFTRTINAGQQLPLDTIFNGKIRASNLQHGTGTYRVYAVFRDLEGNILKTNSGSELKAWWQFSKT
jgi:hypothetical protein